MYAKHKEMFEEYLKTKLEEQTKTTCISRDQARTVLKALKALKKGKKIDGAMRTKISRRNFTAVEKNGRILLTLLFLTMLALRYPRSIVLVRNYLVYLGKSFL